MLLDPPPIELALLPTSIWQELTPTLDAQFAVLAWVEAELQSRRRLREPEKTALTASDLRRKMVQAQVDDALNARAVKACEEMQAKRDAEGARIRAQQAWNEEEWTTGVAEDDPRLRMNVACTEAIVNGHSTYLAQIPQHQQEVVVPALGRSKRSAVSEYAVVGQHQKVGWNFYTDLFECHECDVGAALKMDLMKLPCKRKKGRR